VSGDPPDPAQADPTGSGPTPPDPELPDPTPPGSAQHVSVRRGTYHDSVTLLRVSQAVADAPGVTAAQVAMATPLNTELAGGLGFSIPAEAGPNDLLIAVRGRDSAVVDAALAALESALSAPAVPSSGGSAGAAPPRTVRSAAAAQPEASLVLLSVPGDAVLGEALDAIGAGRHVMIFSDNVPIGHEIALKDAAAKAGVLVMGPDCGTAVINGVGLGFANVLRDNASGRAAAGPRVGIVAASGTGAQQLMCLLDDAGVAVSHVLGLGGRDLSEAVGGRSAVTALLMLDADPATDHIVLISKPPHAIAEASVRGVARSLRTPVSFILIGPGQRDITAGAEAVLTTLGAAGPVWPSWTPDTTAADEGTGRPGALRGLYSGGTLADEAMVVAGSILGDIRSNIPLRPDLALPADAVRRGRPKLDGLGHAVIDLGDDAFTVGRPHPMIDPTLRLDLIAEQAADPGVAVLLLDVVLGHAADPDPAGRLAPAIRTAITTAAAAGHTLSVVVALCGTVGDPQDRQAQAAALVVAGARVFASNAAAARTAAALTNRTVPDTAEGRTEVAANPGPRIATEAQPTIPDPAVGAPGADVPDLLAGPATVICSGIDLLADALREQAVDVITVDYRPAAFETADAAEVPAALQRVLADRRRAAANALAARRMLAVRAVLVDVRPASQALGLRPGEFCHAGPPIAFPSASGPLRGGLIGAMIFEGLAADETEAIAKLAAGKEISLGPCHDRHAVGPMAGVISPSMWLFELTDEATGARSFCSLNEGLGKVLRYGAYSPEVIARLRWMADVLGPALAIAVKGAGPIDITAIIGQMVQMGDEGHNRNRAGTLMFLREILPSLIGSGLPPGDIAEVARFVAGNDHFFLNLVMPAGKLMGDAAAGIPGSTVVTAMCRNGTDFGIRVSGTGDQWFTGPALYPNGLFLAGFGPDDANPDIGDSAIAETMGIGGMVMATAPAIVRLVGGSVPDALAVTARMYEITESENPAFAVPILEFRGAPTGIDVTRVLRTGILPQINTGMAGRVPGTGQVGAGLVTPPMECFTAAIAGLADRVEAEEASVAPAAG
jgi:succinyl-CoA synthetase alpha subunit